MFFYSGGINPFLCAHYFQEVIVIGQISITVHKIFILTCHESFEGIESADITEQRGFSFVRLLPLASRSTSKMHQ